MNLQPSTSAVSGLLSVLDAYDAFVFDQYGVLHNGSALYPNVLSVLQKLKAAGKTILVLTNSGRTAQENIQRLASLEIDPALIDNVITSGDIASRQVLPRYAADFGGRCFHIASENADPTSIRTPAALSFVASPEESDFVYLSGLPASVGCTWQQDLLPDLVTSGVPLLCSNPDNVAPGADGLSVSPGTVAKAYRDKGGRVELVGKPNPLIYRFVRQSLDELGCKRPVFVGDSYHHDIVGAGRAGFDGFLVQTGIHHAAFATGKQLEILQNFIEEGEIAPRWVAATL